MNLHHPVNRCCSYKYLKDHITRLSVVWMSDDRYVSYQDQKLNLCNWLEMTVIPFGFRLTKYRNSASTHPDTAEYCRTLVLNLTWNQCTWSDTSKTVFVTEAVSVSISASQPWYRFGGDCPKSKRIRNKHPIWTLGSMRDHPCNWVIICHSVG